MLPPAPGQARSNRRNRKNRDISALSAKGSMPDSGDRLPEMTGQAIQFTGIAPETGKAIAEAGRAGEERPQFKSPLKQVLYEGGEMLAPSVAIPATLGMAGVGVLPASIATAALFGLSQAQSTKEEAEKRGVEPGAAPYATGAIEAVGETVGTAALARLLGPLAPILTRGGKVAVKDVIKPTVSETSERISPDHGHRGRDRIRAAVRASVGGEGGRDPARSGTGHGRPWNTCAHGSPHRADHGHGGSFPEAPGEIC